MSEFWQLLLILGAIYASECFILLRVGGVVIRRRGLVWGPRVTIGQGAGGIETMSPLPLGADFIAEVWPICPGVHAVWGGACESPAFTRPHQPERLLGWGDVTRVERDGVRVLVNGELFATTTTRAMARRVADLLRDLAATPADQREARIDAAVAEAMDVAAVRRRLAAARVRLMVLRGVGTAMLLLLFIVVPLCHDRWPVRAWVWWVLAAGLEMIAIQSVLFGELIGEIELSDRARRWSQRLLVTLAPTAAMRAAASITREIVGDCHPLAVSLAVCDGPRRHEAAVRVIRELHFPLEPGDETANPGGPEAAGNPGARLRDEFRRRLARAAARLLESEGIAAEAQVDEPMRTDPSSVAYCPRCLSEFVRAEARCELCRRSVVLFATAGESTAVGSADR